MALSKAVLVVLAVYILLSTTSFFILSTDVFKAVNALSNSLSAFVSASNFTLYNLSLSSFGSFSTNALASPTNVVASATKSCASFILSPTVATCTRSLYALAILR